MRSNFLKKAIVFFIPNFNISTISRRGTQVNAMRVRRNSAESIRIQPQDLSLIHILPILWKQL